MIEIVENGKAAELYDKISKMIAESRAVVAQSLNVAMTLLYWGIGEVICLNVLNNGKAEYGQRTRV